MATGIDFNQQLLDAISDSVMVLDLEGRVVYVNETACKSRGYTRDELLKMELRDLVSPEYALQVKPMIREIQSKGQSIFRSVHIRKDKSAMPVEIHSSVAALDNQKYIISVAREIPEYKRIDSLQEIEERYKAIFDRSFDIVYIHDFDGNFQDANDTALQRFGYKKEEIRHLNLKSIMSPDQLEKARASINVALNTGMLGEPIEYRVLTRTGEYLDVETKISVIYHDGIPCAIQGIARDITDRKRAVELLTNERNKLQSFIDSLNCGMTIIDLNFNIVHQNSFLKNVYGDCLGKKCYESYEYKSQPCEGCPVMLCLQDGKTHTAERKVQLADGQTIYWENTASPIKDAEGKIISILELTRDISESKQAEDELNRLQIQQQTILDNIPDMAWVKDTESRYIAVNEALAASSGAQVQDMLGKTDRAFYPKTIAERYMGDDAQVMKSGQRKIIEEPFLDVNKGLTWIETVKTPIYSQNGKVIGTTGIARDITKRKKMEERLQESERRFRELADLLPVIAFEADLSGRITYVNNQAYKLFGYTREEFIGRPIFDFIVPEDREHSISNAQRVLKGEYLGNNEYTTMRKDGSRLTALIQTAPMLDEQGVITGSRGVLVDITSQKNTENEMRASEQKFRALFEQSQEGIILVDSRGRVIGWNAVQEHLTGIRTEEVLGRYIWDDPERVDINDHNTITNRDAFNIELKRVLETRQSPLLNQLSEIEMKTSQGVYHVCLSVMILIDMGTDFMIALVSQDITERKIIEKALQESEEKYRNLVQNIKLGVFRTVPEKQGKIVEANKAMEELTGYSRGELIGMEAVKMYSRPEERAEFLRQLNLTPEKATLTSHLQRKDGTLITASMIAKAITDQNGKLLYIDGTLEDITERQQMEERIMDLYEMEKKQRQELQEEARTRGMFIDVLAHELRTPLTPILASIGMLNELLDIEGDVKKRLAKNIQTSAEMLSKRLEDLLELARFSRGTFKLDRQIVNTAEYLNEVLTRFKPSIDQRKQNLVIKIAESLPEAEIDQSRLEQVIVNLLSNASKFSPDGGHITFKARMNDEGLLVEVQDEGIGISPEETQRIFQPYHRVEQDRHKFPGLGLGLAVSKQIVEAHGGRIWVTSELGRGSIFHFLVPMAAK